MGQDYLQEECPPKAEDTHPCWREVLEAAMAGIYPTDQQLERMIDHLEGTP